MWRNDNISVVSFDLIGGEHNNSSLYFSIVPIDFYEVICRSASSFLHPNEYAYYTCLQHRRRQQSYLMGRYVGKKVISHHLNKSNPEEIEIASGILGQPIVNSSYANQLGISISHSDRYAAAITFSNVFIIGIDIETIENCQIKFMQSILTEKEFAFVNSGIEAKERLCAFLWTAKEALAKAMKCGLMLPFKILEIKTDGLEREFYHIRKKAINLTFSNFPFFKTCSWIVDDQVISILLPAEIKVAFAKERHCTGFENHLT